MIRPGCIEHPVGSRFLAVRPHYTEICRRNGCAGALLSIFEAWTNHKLNDGAGDPFIYRSREELLADLCGLWGKTALDRALGLLIDDLKLVERRTNPRHGWDRKLQYRLATWRLQDLIDGLESHSSIPDYEEPSDSSKPDDASSEIGLSIVGNRTIDSPKSDEQYKRIVKENPEENLEESRSPEDHEEVTATSGADPLSQLIQVEKEMLELRDELERTPSRFRPLGEIALRSLEDQVEAGAEVERWARRLGVIA